MKSASIIFDKRHGVTAVVVAVLCALLPQVAAGEKTPVIKDYQELSTGWPAMFGGTGAGQQMVVRQIDLSLDRVPTRVEPTVKRNYDGMMIGPDFTACDRGRGKMLVFARAVKNPQGVTARQLIQVMRESGCNSLRVFDGYWYDPLGESTRLPILAHFGIVPKSYLTQKRYDDSPWPDGKEVFELLAGNGCDVILTLNPICSAHEPDTV